MYKNSKMNIIIKNIGPLSVACPHLILWSTEHGIRPKYF